MTRSCELDGALRDGVSAIGSAVAKGLSEADTQVLLTHLTAAWASARITTLVNDTFAPARMMRSFRSDERVRRR